jgi:integrase
MASIRKRQWRNDQGQAKTAWTVDFTDRHGNRQRNQFSTRREADAFRIRTENDISRGAYRFDASRWTVGDLCDAYIAYCEGRMARNERMTRKTLAVYRGHINNYILDPDRGVADAKLSELTPRLVGDFRDRVRTAGTAVVTTRKVLATLHAALEYGISQDVVGTNAAHGVKVIGPRDEGAAKIDAPSKDDIRRLVAAADGWFQVALSLAVSTGLRAGELWELKWKDIDFERGVVSVSRRVDVYGEVGPPKSAAGVRDVPLSSPMVQRLREWHLQSKHSRPEDHVFTAKGGRHRSHDNVIKRQFKPLLKEIGASHITWHALRHFAISTWIEAGLSPKAVQTFAGHSSLQVTMDRYGHLFPNEGHHEKMDQIARDIW